MAPRAPYWRSALILLPNKPHVPIKQLTKKALHSAYALECSFYIMSSTGTCTEIHLLEHF
jgi:hypothetical protein